jgi:hypothetical protein
MRRQTREGKKVDEEPKQPVETGFEGWKLWQKAMEDREIDPVEFFDPEGFGYRRRGPDAPRR